MIFLTIQKYRKTTMAVTFYGANFGLNEAFIGEAIIEVLEMLEDRYSIDINQLEMLYRLEHPSNI